MMHYPGIDPDMLGNVDFATMPAATFLRGQKPDGWPCTASARHARTYFKKAVSPALLPARDQSTRSIGLTAPVGKGRAIQRLGMGLDDQRTLRYPHIAGATARIILRFAIIPALAIAVRVIGPTTRIGFDTAIELVGPCQLIVGRHGQSRRWRRRWSVTHGYGRRGNAARQEQWPDPARSAPMTVQHQATSSLKDAADA